MYATCTDDTNEIGYSFLSSFSLVRPAIRSNAFAGVIASFFSSFTLCPTELVKCKLQSLREVAVNKSLEFLSIQYITCILSWSWRFP